MKVSDLSIAYGNGAKVTRVVSFLSFSAAPGEVTALIGPSGVGKSSVLRVLADLLSPESGSFDVEPPVALVYQDHRLVSFLTVEENLRLAAELAGADLDTTRVQTLLASVGLAGFEAREPDTLSGGEQQRVALARAIGTDAKTLLIDEPTGSLDQATAVSVAALLKELAREWRTTMLVATHDPLVFNSAESVIDLARPHTSAT